MTGDMREHFNHLMAVEGVRGAMLFRPNGELVFNEFRISGGETATAVDWFALVAELGEAREAEMVFERGRVYMRRAADVVLVVVTGPIAPSAVIRLHCDILLASLREQQTETGIKRFFKQRKAVWEK